MTSNATLRATSTSRVVESMQSVFRETSLGNDRRVEMIPPDSEYTVLTCGEDGSIVTIVPEERTALIIKLRSQSSSMFYKSHTHSSGVITTVMCASGKWRKKF